MSGNEAVAYGAWLAGVKVGSGYPGTPSTEILESLARYDDVYVEWAPNEKVAFDVCVGAAYAGLRALVTMKHVGLNVASDSLFYASYTGVRGGLVAVTADDPGMFSSQGEQDNRHYARFAKVPMLEPSDSEEAKRFTLIAFKLSEGFDTPVLLRSTTRLSHSKSVVTLEEQCRHAVGSSPGGATFESNPEKYVMVPKYARIRHGAVERRLEGLREFAESFEENRIESGAGEIGVISAGTAYQYAKEVFEGASFLKLGMTYPLPQELIKRFARGAKRLVVVEELDPFLEEQIRAMGVEVEGLSLRPPTGELNPTLIWEGAARRGLVHLCDAYRSPRENILPDRPPVLCPGCGHRGIFYLLRDMKFKVFGDIGCYTLAVQPPLSAIDTVGCMGASIGVLHGVTKAGIRRKVAAVIGDSTFFHSGIAPLMNVIYNGGCGLIIILDNGTTAMTGHQPHAGSGITLKGEPAPRVDIAGLVRALGVEEVYEVDGYAIDEMREILRAIAGRDEPAEKPAVLVVRRPCVLKTREKRARARIIPEKCGGCLLCTKLGCPSLSEDSGDVGVDPVTCVGCGICAAICPKDAIVVERGY